MMTNHIPVTERLRHRIANLYGKIEQARGPSPRTGNPYYCCKICGIHDPEISIRGGAHFNGCPIPGFEKQIEYYKRLLKDCVSKQKERTV